MDLSAKAAETQRVRRRHGSLSRCCASICLLVLAAVVLPACQPQSKQPFRVGSNVWPGYETLYLARELDAYRASHIKLVEFINASEVLQALRNGTIEAAALTLDEALSVAQDGYDLRVVLVMDFSRGGDALLAQPGITGIEALRGRRVGVEYIAVGAIVMDAALRKAALTPDDVTVVPLTVNKHGSAFDNGDVDAVVTFEPVRTRLLQSGARLLFDSGEIPDRVVDVLVVPANVARRHTDLLKTLLRGHLVAQAFLKTQPDRAAGLVAARLDIPAAQVPAMYTGLHLPDLAENHRLLSSGPCSLESSLGQRVDLMRDRDLLRALPVTRLMLSDEWLPDAP